MLKRSYEENGLKSVRWLKHQIWSFLKGILWREWPQKRQVAQASNVMISYIDLIEEMASKASGGSAIRFNYFLKGSYEGNSLKSARWLKHQIWWLLNEILWRDSLKRVRWLKHQILWPLKEILGRDSLKSIHALPYITNKVSIFINAQ